MVSFGIPDEKKVRVIINTDAKNEVDDQFAIVQALLTESFDLKGFIAAHFGEEKSRTSLEDSYDEILKVMALMDMSGTVPVVKGAPHAMTAEDAPIASPGAQMIIDEAMKDDPRPLYIAFLGPLTDMASALLLAPEIAQRNVTVIWIGGGNWPCGCWEYNLKNDVHAANAVLSSQVQLWQVPRDVYRMMPVTFAELMERVHPHGAIGRYLAENVIAFNNELPGRPCEYRILGDSPAIGLMIFSDCGEWDWKPAPNIAPSMHYIHSGKNRPIRVYRNINARFILEDLYAKLKMAAKTDI